MINSKQRAYLRSMANNIEPLYQIGKNGVTDTVIETLDAALEARELIKITVLETSPLSAREATTHLIARLGCDPVQVIGRKAVIYRKSEKEPVIVLPK